MRAFARVVTVILALAVFVAGFAGATAALDIYQPANAKVTTMVKFEVKDGDSTNSVAQRLQDDGLIRNALVFRLWARYKHLDSGIQKGVYILSPSMTMDEIIAALQTAPRDDIAVTVPDGMRATQYPAYLTNLPKFDATQFLAMAKTGIEPDGTKLWTKYWFIPAPVAHSKVAYVLEGYLYPAGYDFFPDATATTVVEKMLDQFTFELCPGPDSKPAQYADDAAGCRAHATTLNGTNIFDLMRKTYPDAKSDSAALRDTLILSSFAAREIKNYTDATGVAAVYYNRYQHMVQGVGDFVTLGSDPSVEYARDNDKPPADGKWWKALINISGNDVAPNNPYNTYTQPGMPPGPIASPFWKEIEAAIAPAKSPYFYFVSNNCGKILYAKDNAGFAVIQSQMNNAKC